jgi:type VI secretion system protein ImpH
VTVLEELELTPWVFDFHLALRRVDCAFPHRPSSGSARLPSEEPIRVGQDPSLAFAPAAIRSFVAPHGDAPGRLRVAFLGLFGPNGPLPLHLTEHALDRIRDADDPTFAAFVDLFQHRLLLFFQRAWAMCQPAVGQDRTNANPFVRYLGSLCGLGLPSMVGRDAIPHHAKIQFCARLMGNSRNAEGLEAIVREYFGLPAKLEEFVGEWLEIPSENRWRLGHSRDVSALGDSAVLGARSFQRGQKFRVALGPLKASDFHSFLPGTPRLAALAGLVRMYVGDELAWDVRLVHEPEERRQLQLGRGGRVGYNTWLGNDRRAGVGIEDLVVEPPASPR